ncbi:CoA-binding protein [Arenibacter sp. GZD96]|uniref:CoA-binding protein n=1 Tax=Aurantibrevibacter litoralis TaxID=3106030 RepID=UPI002AFDDAAC|nr:CoA-binding protein [Arenibacter sp. GZD-96]MEA1787556.1 CoA-binding protein [Arenibacter sp. GZD-96]
MRTLVFGASLKPNRYSNLAIHRLVQNQIETEAYGLREGTINGVHVKTHLLDFKDIHTVTLYVGAKNQPAYYNAIIGLNPKRVIFNPGTENPEFYALLQDKGIAVEVACTLVLLATGQF